MKKIVLVIALGFGLMSTSWAAEAVNIHERINNVQAPAHQIQSASVLPAVQGETSWVAGMDQHERAIIAHETMNNGPVEAYQRMAENHQEMMGNIAVNDTRPSASFAAMNEHERVAVAHETMNNGQSGAHQAMTEAHRRMINAG